MQSSLLYNHWFGKAVGFVGAFVVAPMDPTLLSLFVIAGVGLGHLFDRWAATQEGANAPRYRVPDAAQRLARETAAELPPAVAYLFSALGTIAKRSGVVTREHIRYAEQLMRVLKLTATQRKRAIEHFELGKHNNFAFASAAPPLLKHPNVTELRHFILQAMVDTAAIAPSDAALSACVHIAQHLHISGAVVAEEFSLALAARYPKTRRQGKAQPEPGEPAAPDAELADAYRVLALRPEASAAEVKRAYRQLVSRHHPDKLARNATPRQLEAAQRKMVALREALETIEAAQSA